MERYGPESYGEGIADVYDTWHAGMDPTATVDLLASLVGNGPNGSALELAVGTGRVAIPLAERGFDVHAIDASEAMVERLRAKPGADRIDVTIGDMADVATATGHRSRWCSSSSTRSSLCRHRTTRSAASPTSPTG